MIDAFYIKPDYIPVIGCPIWYEVRYQTMGARVTFLQEERTRHRWMYYDDKKIQ